MGITRPTAFGVVCGLALATMFVPPAQAGAQAGGGLHVIPFPGTPDAAPRSRIIFSSLKRSDLARVTATGSRSGGHAGRLIVLPDRAGTAFVPARPFTAGEQVTVAAQLTSPFAGTASGRPGAIALNFSFNVGVRTTLPAARQPSHAPATASRPPTQSFHSAPALHPPIVNVSGDRDSSAGDIFLTPRTDSGGAPMIVNSGGQLVWLGPQGHQLPFNLEVQRYHGRRVLTWWQGAAPDGHATHGRDVILDRSYRTVAVLHGGNGYSSDLHEFQITPQGTALIDAYVPVRADLSSVGGRANGTVLDCVIQELDIATGQVLWEWHALGHVPVSASRVGIASSAPYDYFHLNSVQQLPDHNLLISARNTWAVYEIDRSTGRVIWTLGGSRSSFRMLSGTRFEWQHDARMHGQTLSLFNDAALPQEEQESSAMQLRLDLRAMTASLVHRYTHSPPLLSASGGNTQVLPGGNVFVGWGAEPTFSEYTAGGRRVFSGSFPLPFRSYRAFRFRWTGRPRKPPSLALSPLPNGTTKIYASWNGATAVAAWRVLGGASPGAMVWSARRSRTGFETAMELHGEPPYIALQALDDHGHVLGTLPPRPDPPHLALFGSRAFVRTPAGSGLVPVGCFIGRTCHVTVRITAGTRTLGRSALTTVPAGRGTLVGFRLSPAARRALQRQPRLAVRVSVRDRSGAGARTQMILIPYSARETRPALARSQSAALLILGSQQFVARRGRGGILAACYAASPCAIKATITSAGQVIATGGPHRLGAEDLGDVEFRLNRAGQAMLAGAPGNQLTAQVTLTKGGDTVDGQVELVRYG